MKTLALVSLLAVSPLVAQDVYDTSSIVSSNPDSTTYLSLQGVAAFNAKGGDLNADLAGGLLSINVFDAVGKDRMHSFVLQTGYMVGNAKETVYGAFDHKTFNSYDKTQMKNCPILAGYQGHFAVSERTSLYVSAKAGIALTSFKNNWGSYSYDNSNGQATGFSDGTKDTKTGGAFAVGAGVRVMLNNSIDFVAGYEYYKVFTKYQGGYADPGYNMIHAGISIGF